MKRTMLVPAQWNGSVEHFYHFFFGYFLPVVIYQERTKSLEFAVRDCGPMNPWFDLLRPGTDLEFMPPGVMMHRVLTKRQERRILHGWDDPRRFHRTSLATFSSVLRDRVGASNGDHDHPEVPLITVLERRSSPSFYESDSSEVFSSGTAYRSLPNLPSVADALKGNGQVKVVDTTDLSPAEQVRLLSETDVLVAQHGAGLSNMVFMKPGTAVVEIKPRLEATVDAIYRNLAGARRLAYASVDQEQDHAPVEPALVVDAASAVLRDGNGHVPIMTGRLPIRILRQLPRRL